MLGNGIVEIQMDLFDEEQTPFCMKFINLYYPRATRDKE